MCTRIALVLIAWTLAVVPSIQAQAPATDGVASYFDPDSILAFAEYLNLHGDAARAATEYQRYLFNAAPDGQAFAHFRLGQTLLELRDTQKSAGHFAQAARASERLTFRDSSHVAYVGALLAGGYDAQLLMAIDTLDVRTREAQAQFYRIGALANLRQGEWDEAEQVLARIPGVDPSNPSANHGLPTEPITRLIEHGRNLPRKSPLVGSLLSTVVPGAGKVYAGRPIDGLYSLILVGGSAWLAYDGFNGDGTSSIKGWLFSISGAVLYVGNIYGSNIAVRLYNTSVLGNFRNDIQAQISLSTRL